MSRRAVFVGLVIVLALGSAGCSQERSDSKGSNITGSSLANQASGSATVTPNQTPASGQVDQPDSSGFAAAPIRPNAPAKIGAKLKSLEAPPEKALALISLPAKFSGARFELVVSPYGWGPAPQNASREQLIVRIVALKALDDGAKGLKRPVTNSNAVLNLEGALADRKLVATGGKYTVTMAVRPEGDVGAFYVEKIVALK